jgi:NAD(P)-dependent dehydrogenase (short-subunit alcohol dehydrogenase family)
MGQPNSTRGSAVVTGGGRGLGREIAVELAVRGFDVFAGVRRSSAVEPFELPADCPGGVTILEMDVTAAPPKLPDDLAVLVNNAGVRFDYLPIEAVPLDDIHQIFETNVIGAVRMCQAAVPIMRRQGGGAICNITTCGILLPMPFHSIYRASKAALSVVSESLRIEVAPFGIRVIEVPLGSVDTEMLATSPLHRPPAAIRLADYEQLARQFVDLIDPDAVVVASPQAAAAAIADAILASGGPLRWPADPGGAAIVAGSGFEAHEARLRSLMERLQLSP